MVAETTSDSIRSFQWDPDSEPDQAFNCGPSGITTIAEYYKDVNFHVNETRKLATSSHKRGTTVAERKVMLAKRGVPCDIKRLSLDKLQAAVNPRHPIEIAVNLKSVPKSIRKHNFAGTHTIVALYATRATCPVHGRLENGTMIFDPNFHRDRPVHPAQIFYPDHALKGAFEGYGGYSVVPDKAKIIPSRVSYVHTLKVTSPVNVRLGPGAKYADVGTLPKGATVKTIEIERKGQPYRVNGKTRTDWISFKYNGKVRWSARAFFTVV